MGLMDSLKNVASFAAEKAGQAVDKAAQSNGVIGRVKNKDYQSAAELAKIKVKHATHNATLSALQTAKSTANDKRRSASSAEEREHYQSMILDIESRIKELELMVKEEKREISDYQKYN